MNHRHILKESGEEPAESGYPALFQSGQIGRLYLKNRLIMAAMGNALADSEGNITPALLDHYRARAQGGVGLIITQMVSVSAGDVMPYNPRLHEDKYIEGFQKLVRTIHDAGARVCVQLMHPGMLLLLFRNLEPGVKIKAPSITPEMLKDRPFQVLDKAEIERIIQDFAQAAQRALRAGADGLEIHACHGCLLSTFLSPAVNRRTDEYGGNTARRTRLVRRVVEEIRRQAGADFPLIVRINGADGVEGGVTPEEVVEQSMIIEAAGASAVSLSSGLEYWSTLMAPSYLTGEGVILPVAEKVKKAVRIPVIVAGKIPPELGEKVIRQGRADFIALGRPLLADPDLPDKLRRGLYQDIHQCLYCNNCLRSSWRTCTVNPFLYRDASARLEPSTSPKKIMVIGGGLAGMQAAGYLKQKGHEVSLFEKNLQLGGQWSIAGSLPGKEGYCSVLSHLQRKLEKLLVPVTLGYEVTRENVQSFKPDNAVVATGAAPLELEIPGSLQTHVIQANDVIAWKKETRGRVAVIGGRVLGMETALLLAEQGKEVCLVSRSSLGGRKGADEKITFRALLRELVRLRIPLYLNAVVLEITPGAVMVGLGEEILALPADTVVQAIGVRAEDRLAAELKGVVPEIYTIGDCVQPGCASQATFSAARLALRL